MTAVLSRPLVVPEQGKVQVALRVSGSIKLGVGPRNVPDILAKMRDEGHLVDDVGYDVLSGPEFEVSRRAVSINLAVISVADLGLAEGGSFRDILEKGKERGGVLCPNEVGLQLCRQGLRRVFPDIRENVCLFVAMRPVVAKSSQLQIAHSAPLTKGRTYIFRVLHDKRLSEEAGRERCWLAGITCDECQFFLPDRLIVFLVPRQL